MTRLSDMETFYQEDGNLTVEFLWVMDNSGTMSEEQEVVVAGLGVFVDVLESFGADWQIGVTTTDVTSGGGLIQSGILTPLGADVEAAFASALEVGKAGSIEEAGLEAMRLATSEPLLSGDNAGFIRDGAGLSVVIVSDEDDQSPLAISEYEAHLAALKGAQAARVSVVVGDLPAGCATSYAAADAGERYRTISTDTGGHSDTICRRDFTPTMKALALNGLGLTDTFNLAVVPEVGSIRVTVDGVRVYQRPENGWSYDPGANAIIFDGYAIPGPGSQVVVEYYAWRGTELQTDTATQ
ncbi:MAG: hypothetical protein FJ090_09225 [Deltaproteobacteria bacterium]|nr:hypothetical protein [Deltaproteobacteria bacterium]